jgi:hypothetical protein
MKFNISTEFLIVVFLLLSVMIISSYGSTKIMPFESSSSTLPMFPYRDGFSDYNENVKVIPNSESKGDVKPNQSDETLQKLHWADYGIQEKPLDIMSQLPSSPDCLNISSGLSNSRGYLCPTDDVQKLYKSRGGNSSGQPSQIGA